MHYIYAICQYFYLYQFSQIFYNFYSPEIIVAPYFHNTERLNITLCLFLNLIGLGFYGPVLGTKLYLVSANMQGSKLAV